MRPSRSASIASRFAGFRRRAEFRESPTRHRRIATRRSKSNVARTSSLGFEFSIHFDLPPRGRVISAISQLVAATIARFPLIQLSRNHILSLIRITDLLITVFSSLSLLFYTLALFNEYTYSDQYTEVPANTPRFTHTALRIADHSPPRIIIMS